MSSFAYEQDSIQGIKIPKELGHEAEIYKGSGVICDCPKEAIVIKKEKR